MKKETIEQFFARQEQESRFAVITLVVVFSVLLITPIIGMICSRL